MLKVKINKHIWKVHKLTDKRFFTLFPKYTGTLAVTHYNHQSNSRDIYFRASRISRSTVIHEITHAFLSYRDLSTMSYGQIEEVFCDFLGNNLNKILLVTNLVLKGLR